MEIGSEFWLENIPDGSQDEIPNWLTKFGNTILTSSGRGAISLLLQQVTPKYKSALLPAYICESVILPFIEQGYNCYFYEIEEDLSPNIKSIKSFEKVGLFLHMGYFGFPTNTNLITVIQDLKKQSTLIIEDITHTLFSNFNRFEYNDFYVGSIRKWFGVPSGGFLVATKGKLKRSLLVNNDYAKLRIVALSTKWQYVKTNNESLKELFLNQFSMAESLLNRNVAPYCIDSVSTELLNLLNVDDLISKRRENYKVLAEGLRCVNYLEAIFDELTTSTSPMFFPVLIKSDRDQVQQKLISENIYCPVHWTVPNQIKARNLDSTLGIYNTILSIPCDQRYGVNEMKTITSILRNL